MAGSKHGMSVGAVCVFAAMQLAGCGGSNSSSVSTPITPIAPATNPAVVAKNVYVIDLLASTVDVYAANRIGTASPSSSYNVRASAVTGDPSGALYFGALTTPNASVQMYASGATTVTRTLSVPNTVNASSNQISTMVADKSGNLYVAFSNVIYEYAAGASGSDAPMRTLTNLVDSVSQMAVDSAGNLFVAEDGYSTAELVEFAPAATGNAAPMTIAASPTYYPSGVAIDTSDNIYISQGSSPCGGCGTYSPAINVFSKGAVTGAKPTRTIAGSNVGVFIYSQSLWVDAAGNIFLPVVANGYINELVYSATANGNVAPSSQLVLNSSHTTDGQSYVR